MKISIWYEVTNRPWGGANSFLKALTGHLIKGGHYVYSNPNPDADVILINSWMSGQGKYLSERMVSEVKKYGDISFIRKIFPFAGCLHTRGKNEGTPIIHRLDGIVSLYGRIDNADGLQIKINRLTDFTVFQSEYCRKSFSEFNVKPHNSSVIHNGVDNSLYFPTKEPKNLGSALKALAVSWSSNPKKGFATLVDFADMPNVDLTFIGNWCDSVPRGNVKLVGIKTASEIAEIMRQSDILIHAAENDPCPNVVLEALASGLPILYKDSGGVDELAKDYGVPIIGDINSSVEEIKDKYLKLRGKILEDLHLFSIEHAADKYLKVFEAALKQK